MLHGCNQAKAAREADCPVNAIKKAGAWDDHPEDILSRAKEDEERILWCHSENAQRQYMVWAEVFIDHCLAAWNPKFAADPNTYFTSPSNKYEELIFWYPGAERHVKLRIDKVNAAKKKADDPAGDGSLPPLPISAHEQIPASKLTDADVLRCAKKPCEESCSRERTQSGWHKEGIFPKFDCALFWRLKAEESKKGESS